MQRQVNVVNVLHQHTVDNSEPREIRQSKSFTSAKSAEKRVFAKSVGSHTHTSPQAKHQEINQSRPVSYLTICVMNATVAY